MAEVKSSIVKHKLGAVSDVHLFSQQDIFFTTHLLSNSSAYHQLKSAFENKVFMLGRGW